MKIIDTIKKIEDLNFLVNIFLKSVPKNKFIHTTELLSEIKNTTNDLELEKLLIIISWDGVDNRYTELLCELLMEKWHFSHEDIIMLLEELKDPVSIECLYSRALEIPEYDDGRSIAKKCIWALGAINTIASKQKLNLLKDHEDTIIKEEATKQIDFLNSKPNIF